MQPRYDFKVLGVYKIVDGDTVDLNLDVGFRTILTQRIRLAIVDTPERSEVGWDRARMFLSDWLRERIYNLRVTTYKEDSFARWIADIYDSSNGETASEFLLEHDLAEIWH